MNLSVSVSVLSGATSSYPLLAHAKSTLALGGNPNLWKTMVTWSSFFKNTGSIASAAVIQLPQDDVLAGTLVQVLRGFDKVLLDVGKTKAVLFALTQQDLDYWDVRAQD